MANEVRTYTITIGDVFNNGVKCENPIITVAGGQDISISCIDPTCGEYKVQVGPGVTEPCITFLVECEDCGSCPPQEITKCFCDSIDDCDDCEFCNSGGFCEKFCPTDECVNGTCVECETEADCTCNRVCDNGVCSCPAGTTLNSITGCCDECSSNADCEECDECQLANGIRSCVPKQCTNGVPKIGTCECVECNNSGDCDGPHECCTSNNECQCCEGFKRVNGICVENECDFDSDCEACEYCDTTLGCLPKDCGTKVCNPETGNCEEPCDGDCPEGYGCLNGFCVPCSTLSCSGIVSECSQAQGCLCNGSSCEWVDCTSQDCVDWVITPPNVIPGNPVPGSGVPAPSFTVTFTQLGIVTMSGGSGSFLDYSITITETGGNSGSWNAEGSPLGTGSSVTFTLSQVSNIQWNNVGFEVTFTGNLGQTGSIVIYNTNWFDPDPAGANESFFADLFTTPANWVYEVQGNAVAPTVTGGSFTAGSLKLCPCGDSEIIGYSWTTIEGNLTVTFTPLPDGCVRANVQGCGVGEGTVTIDCAGVQTTLDLPPLPYDFSGSNCCNPLTDPNCNATPGDGFGCTSLDVLNGDIALSNTNFITGDGYGLFRGVFQPDSIGYTIPQWIRAARNVCWSVTGTVREATSFIPPTLAHLFHDVEYRTGEGCLRLGYTCDIKVANCKKVQAEACFMGCTAFDVTILGSAPNFSAVTSLGNAVQVSYAWTANNGQVGTGSTFTIPDPNTQITSITVVATLNVNGTVCVASDTIAFELSAVGGCTNQFACNYDENATFDDGSCINVAAPTYSCPVGFVPGLFTILAQDNPTIVYRIFGGIHNGTSVTLGSKINSGTYTVRVYFDEVEGCEFTLVVPTCYNCNVDVCEAASQVANPSVNIGAYDEATCGGGCGCSIEIVAYAVCDSAQNGGIIHVSATGDTGLYVASITKQGGGNLVIGNPTMSGGEALSALACDGNYTIRVVGDNCEETFTLIVDCWNCVDTNMTFTADARYNAGNANHQLSQNGLAFFDCASNNVNLTFTADSCSTSYTVRFLNSSNVAIGSTPTYSVGGQKTIATGPYNLFGDGAYTIQITDNTNACVIEEPILLNCDGTLEDCALTGITVQVQSDGSHLSFPVTFTLDNADDTYLIQLYNVVGGVGATCAGGVTGSLIAQQGGIAGVIGSNFYTGFLYPAINVPDFPSIDRCYQIIITNENDPSCTISYMINSADVVPTGPCMITIDTVTPNYETGYVYIAWTGSGTTNDVTVRVYVAAGAVCDTGIDPYTEVDGLGQSGFMNFGPIPQLQGQDQCITVEVFDTADPTCIDTLESVIEGCECNIVITNVVIDSTPGDEKAIIDFTSECTSGEIDITITGDATGSTTINALDDPDPSENGVIVQHLEVEVPLTGYPSTGGVIDVEITDNADGTCTDIQTNVILPDNCVYCAQVIPWIANGDIPESDDQTTDDVRTEANVDIVTGGPYNRVTDTNTFRTALINGLLAAGANFCTAASAQRVTIQQSGISVSQDSTDNIILDRIEVSSSEWAGTRDFYFTDCSCGNRLCDYDVTVVLDPTTQSIYFRYGTLAGDGGYSSQTGINTADLSFSYPPSPSQLAAFEASLQAELNTATAGCELESGDITVSYNGGTSELTISIPATNVGFTPLITTTGTTVADEVFDQAVSFVQSNCV